MLVGVTTSQVCRADALERTRIRKLNVQKPSKITKIQLFVKTVLKI